MRQNLKKIETKIWSLSFWVPLKVFYGALRPSLCSEGTLKAVSYALFQLLFPGENCKSLAFKKRYYFLF